MSERFDSVPSLVASLFSLTVPAEYEASFASDFDLVRNLTPLWASPMRKRV
jgi:hypothetical protein